MRIPLLFTLIFISLLFTPFTARHASAADRKAGVEEVISTLEKGYAGLKDLQAAFAQRTSIAGINREQKGAGEVFLKRPPSSTAMFRFNYSTPNQQIVSNGRQVWFYIPENRQVMVTQVSEMFKGGNAIALSYLTGLGNVTRDFNVSFAKESRDKQGNYLLDLLPKKPSPVLARLQLTISAEAVDRLHRDGILLDTFPILSSVIHDAGGNQTRIDYSRVRVNKGLDNGKFNFKIPEGVETIKP